jgi:hypothetical protein
VCGVGFERFDARKQMRDDVLSDFHFTLLQMLKSMRSRFIDVMELVSGGIMVMLLMLGYEGMMSMGHILDILFVFQRLG